MDFLTLTFLLMSFLELIFLFLKSCIFLILSMPHNFFVGLRHCKFYNIECWILLYSFKYCRDLFWEVVKLVGISLILSGLTFKFCEDGCRTVFNQGLI